LKRLILKKEKAENRNWTQINQNQHLFTAECAEPAENIIKTDFLAYVFLGALCVLGGSMEWFQLGLPGINALSAFICVPISLASLKGQ
jgi:hypothetical protein